MRERGPRRWEAMRQFDVLIAGGGISGLAAGWWLARSGLAVAVWEAAARPGGKIESTRVNGYLTERAASMVLNFRPEVTELIAAAGLEALKTRRRQEAEERRYLLRQRRLLALPMKPAALLVSPLWSLSGKLRLLAEPFIGSSARPDESVSEFITRRLGREVLEKAIEPFIAGTLAGDADATCANAALPRLTALERRYGSLTAGIIANRLSRRRTAASTEVFSFLGGMNALVDRLAAHPNLELRTQCRVEELVREGAGWRVGGSGPQGECRGTASQVILSTPAPDAAKLLDEHDIELAALLRGISYAPLAIVHTGFARDAVEHSLEGTGFLAPKAESAVLTGNLWMSSLFPDRAPDGKVLVTSYLGGARFPGASDWSDERLLAETLGTLRPLLGLRAVPEMQRIERHAAALPLYHGAYQRRLRAIEERLTNLPGLHLEANYRGGVAVRDRLARGHALAQKILAAQPFAGRRAETPAGTPGAVVAEST